MILKTLPERERERDRERERGERERERMRNDATRAKVVSEGKKSFRKFDSFSFAVRTTEKLKRKRASDDEKKPRTPQYSSAQLTAEKT